MMQVSADHFSIRDRKYLVMVDRYSSFPIVWEVENLTTPETIKKLKEVFELLGWPAQNQKRRRTGI